MPLLPEIHAHYDAAVESTRLTRSAGQLERARTQQLLTRYLPPAPAPVYDIGGGAGVYAHWLTVRGYEVHLLDAVELHIQQALQAPANAAAPLSSARVGDARVLPFEDESASAVLLLGPLYHLVERADRVLALREASRVLRPGGVVMVAGISRFASAMDGLYDGHIAHPDFAEIVARDLTDGQHRNPTDHVGWFTTAYFHHPHELKAELEDAGLDHEATLGIEGPGWCVPDFHNKWENEQFRVEIIAIAERLKQEETMLGVSAHLMAVGRKR